MAQERAAQLERLGRLRQARLERRPPVRQRLADDSGDDQASLLGDHYQLGAVAGV